ncbi:MAG: VapA/VapB family virulence-associated protein [Enterobacteriaceae bacterium]|nr:VapA/VapB family virulence-associated protein [Enterobacteriaceae bacterium]
MNKTKESKITAEIIKNFKENMKDKLEPKIIDDAVNKMVILGNNNAYEAVCTAKSLFFYIQFSIATISDKKTFTGNAGGYATPGGAYTHGSIYTDDITKLYSDTISFEFNATPVYISVLFFDAHSTLLGHFQSGGVGTISGVGGGSGSWS